MPLDSSVSAGVLPWLWVLVFAAALAAAVGVWVIYHRLRELAHAVGQLSRLEELSASLKKLVGDRSDLDLRRIEHVLIEIRDANRRLEDVLLRLSQSSAASSTSELAVRSGTGGLAERVVTRLFAMGYERVQFVSTQAELDAIGSGDGEVVVEARRAGVPCKGRVLVRGGALTDVELKSAYATFP